MSASLWPRAILLAALLCLPAAAQELGADFGQFRGGDALSVLQKNCAACHNDHTRTSGLSVLSRESLLTGGNRGSALVPGRASDSLLIRAGEQGGELKMPPMGKLPGDAIAVLREWIDRGAHWAGASPPSGGADSKRTTHWAFQPLKRTQVPQVRNAAWSRNPIDNFVLARLESERLD